MSCEHIICKGNIEVFSITKVLLSIQQICVVNVRAGKTANIVVNLCVPNHNVEQCFKGVIKPLVIVQCVLRSVIILIHLVKMSRARNGNITSIQTHVVQNVGVGIMGNSIQGVSF